MSMSWLLKVLPRSSTTWWLVTWSSSVTWHVPFILGGLFCPWNVYHENCILFFISNISYRYLLYMNNEVLGRVTMSWLFPYASIRLCARKSSCTKKVIKYIYLRKRDKWNIVFTFGSIYPILFILPTSIDRNLLHFKNICTSFL